MLRGPAGVGEEVGRAVMRRGSLSAEQTRRPCSGTVGKDTIRPTAGALWPLTAEEALRTFSRFPHLENGRMLFKESENTGERTFVFW